MKGVFSGSYCCYGNLLCHENDENLFTNDWAVFLILLLQHQLIKIGYNDPPKSKSWKLLKIVFSHLKQQISGRIKI